MATLFDSASLVMIPSGVKEDKLYSIKPTDGSGDFTFSRGSDIQATRVNSSGLIEKAKENLLLQSNSFDTTWTYNNTIETGGQSGYDGSSDAWLITKLSPSAFANFKQSISSSGLQTASFYAKAGTLTKVGILVGGGDNPYVSYDLSAGTILAQRASVIDSSITDVGGGWYRCTMTYNVTIVDVNIYPDWDQTNTGTIYIQDAQLNHGLVAQDYVETTTTAVVEGLTADLPRLDYSGGASCPSLLLEPSRTNLLRHSEYFGNYDTQLGATITQNNTISPEGVQNASTFSIQPVQYIYTNTGANLVSGTTYTFSAYVRVTSGTKDFIMFTFSGSGNEFNSPTNTATTEWQRFDLTFTAVANAVTNLYPVGQDGFTGGDFEVYGVQFEVGSYPTSYIPTYGTAAVRGLEYYANNSATDLIGQTEGVLFIDFTPNTDIVSTKWLAFLGSGTDYIGIYVVNGTNKIRLEVGDAGTQASSDTTNAIVEGQRYKCAIAYKQNDFVAYVNGVQIGTDSSGSVPATSTIRSYYNLSSIDSTDTHQLLLFKTRLTNAELAALTTI
jgi:hypothetical protein